MSMFYELMMRKKGMPERYQEVEYIESTETQCIDTGILANDETGMQVDVQWLNDNDTVCIGSRATSINTRCFIGNATMGFYLGWNILGTSRPTHDLNRNVLSLNLYNNRKKIFNGTELSDTLQTLEPQTSNIFLFGTSVENNSTIYYKSSIKLYSAQITQGNQLVRNFIPVYDTLTQKYGMWETVQGKFYGNDGTGDFKGSIVGYTVVGSPTISDGVVSGFSSSNYLTIGSSFSSDDYDVIEFNTKITTGNSIADGLIIGITTFYVVGLAIINSKLTCRVSFGSYSNAISDITLQANTTYTIKGVIDKRTSTISINVNGIVNSNNFTYGTTRNLNYRIGNSDAIGYFNGSIDLNNTNIKRNNKLWFNGQQS